MNDKAAPPTPVRRWAFFAVAVVIGGLCLRLGFWQLDRLEQRRARNATVTARLALTPVRLPEDVAQLDDLVYRRAEARGEFDVEREIYLSGRSLNGIAGLHVVTPLRLDGADLALLVDRGWISDERYRADLPAEWAITGPVVVSGLLLPSQVEPSPAFLADRIPAPGEPPLRSWRALFISGIAGQLPYPVLSVYLLQDGPAPSAAAPRPSIELDLSDGPHLGYAVQWFAFAVTAWVGGIAWLRRRRG